MKKLGFVDGHDPYEIPKREWIDDLSGIVACHVGMYLLFSASSYTQDQLMNYKSLKCYQNFANGWVREVLCKEFGEKWRM